MQGTRFEHQFNGKKTTSSPVNKFFTKEIKIISNFFYFLLDFLELRFENRQKLIFN